MSSIFTERLELLMATRAIVTADLHQRDDLPAAVGAPVADGWPPPLLSVEAMQYLEKSLVENSSQNGWTSYYVLQRTPRLLIGLCGFKTPPKNGAVEFGYTLLPQFHGRGLGTELVEALKNWALAQPNVSCVFAETLPELIASQRVLQKNGFARASESSASDVIRFSIKR